MLITQGKSHQPLLEEMPMQSSKITKILFGEYPKGSQPLKNLNKIHNLSLIKQKYSNLTKLSAAKTPNQTPPKSLQLLDPPKKDHHHSHTLDLQSQKAPKICEIKYRDEKQKSPSILIKNNIFHLNHKRRTLKSSEKEFNDKKMKDEIKVLFSTNSPFKSYHHNEIKIKLETIYGTITTGSPRKAFYQFGQDHDANKKDNHISKNSRRSFYEPHHNKSDDFERKIEGLLKISNNRVLNTHSHVQQLERLKMSVENRKIEEKHRRIKQSNYRQPQIPTFPENKLQKIRGKSILNNPPKNTLQNFKKYRYSIDIHSTQRKSKGRGEKEVPDRYSPWHKQKTQNQPLYEDFEQ